MIPSTEKVFAARTAFSSGNSQESVKVHNQVFDEPHKSQWAKKRRYFQNLLDGMYTGLLVSCLVSSVFYALPKAVELQKLLYTSSFFTVISGVLFGFLDFQRRREYAALYRAEREREHWETINYLEGEQREMIELYTSKGLSRQDAAAVVDILSKKTEFFVDVMMKEELELVPPEESSLNTSTAIHSSLLVFGFFLGIIPSLVFHPSVLEILGAQNAFFSFGCLVCLFSFAVGSLRSLFQANPSWIRAGLEAGSSALIAVYFAYSLTFFWF